MDFQNETLQALLGTSILAYVLYALRAAPSKIRDGLLWAFTSRVVIYNEDGAFEKVTAWLASHNYASKARRLRLTTEGSQWYNSEESVCSPGLGHHLIRHKGKWFAVRREHPTESSGPYYKRREDITIMTLGGPQPLRDLLEDVLKGSQDTLEVYVYNARDELWRLSSRNAIRDISTLDLPTVPEDQKQRIVNDVLDFYASKEWYLQRGVPYRRGILLEGPPGTGKTSLVLAIAGMLRRPLCVLNLGSLKNDEDLINAVTRILPGAILLIEDIDASTASNPRFTNRVKVEGEHDEEKSGLTLSGLLNAIDGAFAREGRLLFMTTNHPDKVDPALIRKGRADLREHIGEMGYPEVLAMCKRFLDDPVKARLVAESVDLPVTPSALQEKLVQVARPSAPLPV